MGYDTRCYFNVQSKADMSLNHGINNCKVEKQQKNQSINQSIMLFRVVQVTKSLQDPLEVGNSLLGISDNVRE